MAAQDHVPAIPELPPLPPQLVEAIAALRPACAAWAPAPGHSDLHAMEAQACDVVLGRDGEFNMGIFAGVGSALVAVAVLCIARKAIRGAIEFYRDSRKTTRLAR